jgi:hypothetical protein
MALNSQPSTMANHTGLARLLSHALPNPRKSVVVAALTRSGHSGRRSWSARSTAHCSGDLTARFAIKSERLISPGA